MVPSRPESVPGLVYPGQGQGRSPNPYQGPYSRPGDACESWGRRVENGARAVRRWDPNAAIMAEIEAENRLFWPERYRRRAVYSAAQAAGLRETAWGTVGRNVDYENMPVGARFRAGHQETGGRGFGLSDRWDISDENFQMSGRMGIGGTLQRSSQRIPCQRPILRLVARGGECRVNVLVGSSMGGAQDSREFVLGNGFIATHDLSSWDNVVIGMLETQPGTTLEFAWISGQSASGDQTLFLPQRFDVGAVVTDVPNGAFKMAAQNAAAVFSWINNTVEGFGTVTFDTALVAGGVVDVLGAQFVTGTPNRYLWLIRPL
jgi:hypothetical protein